MDVNNADKLNMTVINAGHDILKCASFLQAASKALLAENALINSDQQKFPTEACGELI